MNITILAVGKYKASDHFQLIIAEYLKRLRWKINIIEIDNINWKPNILEKLKNLKPTHNIFLLDERGINCSSIELTEYITSSNKNICFCIGGAEGFDDNIRNLADKLFSFGKLTWPHLMARAMLIEQLYRAYTISINHPYHKQ